MRNDLQSIVGFCRTQRGEYSCASKRDKRLWLRIRNVIESEASRGRRHTGAGSAGLLVQLDWPQLGAFCSAAAASAAAIVLVVSLSTVVGLRRWQSGGTGLGPFTVPEDLSLAAAGVRDRFRSNSNRSLIGTNAWNSTRPAGIRRCGKRLIAT